MKIIRPGQLADMLGVSKTTLWRMEKRGELPPRIKISRRAVGWTLRSIKDWLDNRPTAASQTDDII